MYYFRREKLIEGKIYILIYTIYTIIIKIKNPKE